MVTKQYPSPLDSKYGLAFTSSSAVCVDLRDHSSLALHMSRNWSKKYIISCVTHPVMESSYDKCRMSSLKLSHSGSSFVIEHQRRISVVYRCDTVPVTEDAYSTTGQLSLGYSISIRVYLLHMCLMSHVVYMCYVAEHTQVPVCVQSSAQCLSTLSV